MKLVSGTQMQQLDRQAMASGSRSLTLMENAGKAVFDVMRRALPELAQQRALVVAGKGNNGGDGMVVARALNEHGAACKVACLAAPSDCSNETRQQLAWLKEASVEVVHLKPESPALRDLLNQANVVVDALLGVGLRGAVRPPYASVIEQINRANAFRVAVDVPSGLDADTGAIGSVCVSADLTVTLGLPKTGLLFYPGKRFVGRLEVVDIGYHSLLIEQFHSNLWTIDQNFVKTHLPARPEDGHKGTFGRGLLIAGSTGMTGAALLTAQAALRGGAGLVHLAYPQLLDAVIAGQAWGAVKHPLPEGATWTEALSALETMLEKGEAQPPESAPVDKPPKGLLGEAALEPLLEICESMDAVAVGPGLGQDPSTQRLVQRLVEQIKAPLVVDADGLNALVGHVELLKKRRGRTILTPHPGEFSRLTGQSVETISATPIESAQKFAEQTQCVVALKGATTVVAAPGLGVYVNTTGNSGLAKGGSGDALTGLVLSLCAQGAAPWEAACCGVWVHGRAGDLARPKRSERAMQPEDVIEFFSKVFLELDGSGGTLTP